MCFNWSDWVRGGEPDGLEHLVRVFGQRRVRCRRCSLGAKVSRRRIARIAIDQSRQNLRRRAHPRRWPPPRGMYWANDSHHRAVEVTLLPGSPDLSLAWQASEPSWEGCHMSFVVVAPDAIRAAATELAGIGSTLSVVNAASSAQTTAIAAAAGDEVSAAIALLFSSHGQRFQALMAQAAAFHRQSVQAMRPARGHMRALRSATLRCWRPSTRRCWVG